MCVLPLSAFVKVFMRLRVSERKREREANNGQKTGTQNSILVLNI